jgi:catechol 2,3-dioxygenase-like lactoylglutathione lyase family enzyme
MHKVTGVDHVGIGVKDIGTMMSFYQDIPKFKDILAEMPESDHKSIQALMRISPAVFSGRLISRKERGFAVALYRMTDPVPRHIRRDFKYGDIGVAKITIAVPDVENLYRKFKSRVAFFSVPKQTKLPGWGEYRFVYCRDPEGNLIEFISGGDMLPDDRTDGMRWIGVSVTDLHRSQEFYRKYTGFTSVIIDEHECFSGLVDEISGGSRTKVRSCVLASGQDGDMLELFEVMEPRGRSIPFSTRWGDFGYLQVCMSCDDVSETAAYFMKEGIELITEPQWFGDGKNEDAGMFFYIQDPDGIPVEFLSFTH